MAVSSGDCSLSTDISVSVVSVIIAAVYFVIAGVTTANVIAIITIGKTVVIPVVNSTNSTVGRCSSCSLCDYCEILVTAAKMEVIN